MTDCPSCNGFGAFAVRYHDGSPADYALCLCAAGETMRRENNNGKVTTPYWFAWASIMGIDPEHVAPMEDLLTAEEMAARGFTELPASTAIDAVAAAARARSKR